MSQNMQLRPLNGGHHAPPKEIPEPTPDNQQSLLRQNAKPSARQVTTRLGQHPLCKVTTIILIVVVIVIVILCCFFLNQKCETSQWCDGKQDCPSGEDENNCFRFYGPKFMLQSFSNKDQQWKTVCSDNWNDIVGEKVCEQMGYSRSYYNSSGQITMPSSASYLSFLNNTIISSKFIHTHLSNRATCRTNSAVTLKCIDCGMRNNIATRIIGGQAVTTGWPWQVSLHNPEGHECGGSIITPFWIVTAAHCFNNFSSPDNWKVYAGLLTQQDMRNTPGSTVSKIIKHPDFINEQEDNDIALIKVHTSFKMSSMIQPVCLPNVGLKFLPSKEGYISGWGKTAFRKPNPNQLHEAKVFLIDSSTCNSSKVYDGRITESMICAGKLEGGVDSCQGDSGGPLVTEENSLWWLLGDTSWGEMCGFPNKPGVYGNVTFFLDWIYEQIKKK